MKKLLSLLFLLVTACSVYSFRKEMVLTSPYLSKPDTVWVFTPAGYGEDLSKKYPLVYLMHGWSGNYHQWDDIMNCQEYADRYGFILVCPDALYDSWYLNSPVIKQSRYADFFFNDLEPAIRAQYQVDTQNVFITGLSMGGHGALYLFAQRPELFRGAGSLSGVLDLNACPNDYGIPTLLGLTQSSGDKDILTSFSVVGNLGRIKASGKEIIFSCGTGDRFYPVNLEFRKKCDELGIRATSVFNPGGHDYPYWSSNISSHLEFFKRLVKPSLKD